MMKCRYFIIAECGWNRYALTVDLDKIEYSAIKVFCEIQDVPFLIPNLWPDRMLNDVTLGSHIIQHAIAGLKDIMRLEHKLNAVKIYVYQIAFDIKKLL